MDFAKIKQGRTIYDDASINLRQIFHNKRSENEAWRFMDKNFVCEALVTNNIPVIRAISNFFYRTNGIYQKIINYYATMYRYDWYMVAEPFTQTVNETKVVADFNKTLNYFDNSNIKRLCGEFSLQILKDGVYYGYAYEGSDGIVIQELPWQWCRSRFKIRGIPAVEFDMKFFDTKYPSAGYRMQVLDLFPPEFKKGYQLYKQGKLPADDLYVSDGTEKGHWYLLDPECAFKMSIFGTNDLPFFVNAIPEIIDLGIAQGIERQRQLQQLLKILVQKLPLDKNGDLIFDIDEAKDIHQNAVEMLSRCVGVDVLTTFADIEAIDVSEANSVAKDNSLDNAERTVYNALGVSKNLFNTEGNLALEKSVLADEGSLRDLILQYEALFNKIALKRTSNKKKWIFKFYMLYTTQYNYQTLSKMYKEQDQVGFSKMLPQIALGQSQSFILNTAYFENSLLHLSEIMLPPLMSSTLSSADVRDLGGGNKSNNNENSGSTGGRPKKNQDELSEKTIQNQESAN